MATHHFEPDHYYTALGTYPPVLQIRDGDTVITSTVDSQGRDASNAPVTAPGNPQTGPFYVEDAKTGDTLAVRFDRLWPNRPIGYSCIRLAPNVVDPEFVLEFPPDGPLAEWEIDLDAGVAELASPASALGRIALPISPMLGCFGVAPARGQAISTATSGPHGGNMDYRGFRQGATVYLPVFVDGALFFLGDGHAMQGDGEIVGTGVEISFDVEFSVRLLKGKRIRWPRADNDTYILTAGNARPLDQALQHATTEMVRWLQEDFYPDPVAVHTLLGQCVEYEIANVFDPAYTVVCKMARRVLSGSPKIL
ncbi:MAG TPA: acetamidase/formamidase family protein [Armatimonadota bacterium]|nr:acetamidase/formamidase family protein [Armatimonadota bacterium]